MIKKLIYILLFIPAIVVGQSTYLFRGKAGRLNYTPRLNGNGVDNITTFGVMVHLFM